MVSRLDRSKKKNQIAAVEMKNRRKKRRSAGEAEIRWLCDKEEWREQGKNG